MNDLFSSSSGPTLPFELPRQDGYVATWDASRNGHHVKVPNGELFFSKHFFNQKVSDRVVEYFQENETVDWRAARFKELEPDQFDQIKFTNINWKQDFIKLYGKTIPLPRLTSWYGDSGKSYSYSGITAQPNDWNEGLLYIKRLVEAAAEVAFNSVLLNWYRDGTDHLSWHSDDEKELGRCPIIASANFGASRDFVVRRKGDEGARISIPLSHGSLLIMRGELQHFWEHSVPKRARVSQSRFNLTFRRIGV